MNPIFNNKQESDGVLNFRISNIHVSFVNGLRRVILSDIQTVVLKTFPHDESDCVINLNTSKFNNEIIKQRLSCIPIHIDDLTIPINQLVIHLKYENNTSRVEYVTTEHIKIWNTALNAYLPDTEVKNIFPANALSKSYIDILKLSPNHVSDKDKSIGESIDLRCNMSISTAKTNSMFNVVSKVAFANTILPREELEALYSTYESNLKQNDKSDDEELSIIRADWFALNSKRHFVVNSFDFKIQTLGVFTNSHIISKACSVIIDKFNLMLKVETKQDHYNILKNETFSNNCYDIILTNEDYTIGKIIEYMLFTQYIEGEKTMSFVSFIKKHPHDVGSVVRLVFCKDIDAIQELVDILDNVFHKINETFSRIADEFN